MLEFKELLENAKSVKELENENQESLKRLLKNAQSKKCRSLAMNRTTEFDKTCQIIEAIQNELKKYQKQKVVDINQMDLADINKAIKNAQSKKCLALAMGRTEQYNKAIEDENKFLELKDKFAKQPKINKIQVKINELKELEQTEEVVNQIKLLESLL